MTSPSPTPVEPQPFTVEELPNVIAWLANGGPARIAPPPFVRLAATFSSLLADRERLDWLENKRVVSLYYEDTWGGRAGQINPGIMSFRSAIDAARPTPAADHERGGE